MDLDQKRQALVEIEAALVLLREAAAAKHRHDSRWQDTALSIQRLRHTIDGLDER
jgi:hypothetical protein